MRYDPGNLTTGSKTARAAHSFLVKMGIHSYNLRTLVSIYVLSANSSLIDAIKAALKGNSLHTFSAGPEVVTAVLASSRSKWELVIVDVDSVPDGGRLIDFIKSSAPVRASRVLAVGSAAELTKLGNVPGGSADATLEASQVSTQLGAEVAKLRADLGMPGGVRTPEGSSPDLPPRKLP